eukprot:29937-Pelagococcus_subviridis.AAC.5
MSHVSLVNLSAHSGRKTSSDQHRSTPSQCAAATAVANPPALPRTASASGPVADAASSTAPAMD